jgi:hypothetical protein
VTTARLAARAARLEAAISAAVTRATAALPMIGAEEAAAALETAVPITMKGQGPGPVPRRTGRYFLSWTADRGLSRRLTVPAVPSQQPADFLDDGQRWQLL